MPDNTPRWYTKHGIHQIEFAEDYLAEKPMRSFDEQLYTVNGVENDRDLHRDIFRRIRKYLPRNAYKEADALLRTLREMAPADIPPLDPCRIHFANGTFDLNAGFSEEKDFCLNRLPVNFDINAPEPAGWSTFLSQLLEAEDILTLQEYMGYCLIPSTKGQKMLMILGEGGEGKSRIGEVMRALLGGNMEKGSLQKVETDRFYRANLVHKLVLVDDDMSMEALPSTNTIKSIVTAEGTMDVEKKGIQSYQAHLYCRFLAFGNGGLSALHDRSAGFYRRQIVLRAKPRPRDRTDDPFLIEKLLEEKEGILLWCLAGLYRLIGQNYNFTVGRAAKKNLAEVIREGNNVIDFMKSEGYIERNPEHPEWCATSRSLYRAYEKWCDDNAFHALAAQTFLGYLKKNSGMYGLRSVNNIRSGSALVRGFEGLRVVG